MKVKENDGFKRPNKTSVWGIWASTSSHRKRNCSNYLVVSIFSVTAAFVEYKYEVLSGESIREILNILLALNGAILGLMIAGSSFANTIPKTLMAFLASSKASEYPWSNFKNILLNYLYAFTALFTGILLFSFFYLLSYIGISPLDFGCDFYLIFRVIAFTLVWSIQGWLLSEMKVFLFWIYDNSLLLGQMIAELDEDEGIAPIDDGNA